MNLDPQREKRNAWGTEVYPLPIPPRATDAGNKMQTGGICSQKANQINKQNAERSGSGSLPHLSPIFLESFHLQTFP